MKRILSRLSFRQLLRLTGARICQLFQMVRRQKYDLFLLRMLASFRGVQIAIKPIEGFGLRRAEFNLDLMDVAASCAAQRPMLVPRSRRRDPLHHGNPPTTVAS